MGIRPSGPIILLKTGMLVLNMIWAADKSKVKDPINIQNSLELKASSDGLLGYFFQCHRKINNDPNEK